MFTHLVCVGQQALQCWEAGQIVLFRAGLPRIDEHIQNVFQFPDLLPDVGVPVPSGVPLQIAGGVDQGIQRLADGRLAGVVFARDDCQALQCKR